MNRTEKNDADDLEGFDESPYLRRQRAIPVRKKQIETSKLAIFFRIFLTVVLVAGLSIAVYRFVEYATTSPEFQISIREVSGLRNLSGNAVMEQLAPLVGQNIFRADYADRIRALRQIPWVESVVLLRYWPSSVSVIITERKPVGYALVNGIVELIDKEGVPLGPMGDTPQQFDFPVMRGLTPENTTEDHTVNRLRIRHYMDLLKDLDSDQSGYSKDLSEVDVSDADDVKILLKDDPVMVHLGKEDYLQRFKLYLANIKRLEQDHPNIDSIDTRFKDQLVVKLQEKPKEAKK